MPTQVFKSDSELAELLRLIAHPTRIAILRAVAAGERCVTQLNELVRVSQPNLSQHLRILRTSGLIENRRDGRKRCYSLRHDAAAAAFVSTLVGAEPMGMAEDT